LKESADEAETQRRESAATKSSEHVDVSTGEENEVNIHHAMCKLHSFDINTKSWHERGMSSVRINRIDEEPTAHYRIVGRSMGNQRVVLNSRLFTGMVLEKVSAKRIKFSATTPDSELPVLFLTTASEFVTEQLFSKLSEIVKPKKEEEQSRKRKASSEMAAGDTDNATSTKTDAPKKSTS
uniref:RanBD1 domain-containing protein n=1 Tax=Anisakis simplex TaxID=6269 RepID=A0A0M3KJC9_ANISI